MKTEYIADAEGRRKAVILPIRDYEKLLEARDELEDIRLYDSVKTRNEPQIPLNDYLAKRMTRKNGWYQITITRTAQKQLDKLPDEVAELLLTAIQELATNPRPVGRKKMKGRNGYRIREGDYRIIYDIFDEELVIDVIGLGHRGQVYK